VQGSTHTQVNNFKPTEFYGTIKMLIPGKSYIFRIQAETKIGYGPEAIWKQKMPILRKYCILMYWKAQIMVNVFLTVI
jgi:cadherin 5 type 2 (VE-cadherin)